MSIAEGSNVRLTIGSSAVYYRDRERSSLLAVDQCTDEPICLYKPFSCKLCPGIIEISVESQTCTYYGRVGSGIPAKRPSRIAQDRVPTELFAQETKVHRSLQAIEKTSLFRLF